MRTEKIKRGRRFTFNEDEMKKMVREDLEKRGEQVPDDGEEIESFFYEIEYDEECDEEFIFSVRGKPRK